jgi:uncharacterized peroxidase-related enzyme
MSFFKSLPEGAGPGNIFSAYQEIYSHWTKMGEALINGPSALTPGERELIQAYVSGLVDCRYSYIAHCEAAYARGIERGLLDKIVSDPDSAPVKAKLKPILVYVKKLTLTPTEVSQADADAVFDAGWDEKALHDVIAVTARMNFMCRIVEGYGFTPMTPEVARERAEERARVGYVNLYPGMKENS